MRVAVLNTHVPFVRGGAEQLADGLVGALRAAGHDVALVRLPFRWYPDEQILAHMLAARLTDLGDADLVVGLKFPAYLVPHPRKVLWVLHQHRQAYDLWGTPWQGIAADAGGHTVRAAIHKADGRVLREGRRPYVISGNVATRMAHFSGVTPQVLYPPLMDEGYRAGPAEDFIFLPSRINVLKRQTLVVEAMRHVRGETRLVLAGSADTPEIRAELGALLDDPVIARRVTWLDRWIEHEEKLDLLARCAAVAFTPVDEDYGYVTLEAFSSAKPVLTCNDSGGPLEFVVDGETGVVAEPQPRAIAAAIDRLLGDPAHAVRMGERGRARLEELDITWDRVLDELLAA